MASIHSVSIELLTRIFESCDDFPQVIALASTCKGTYEAWETNSGTIIWTVARRQIRSFDDALMAVRATAIVLKAYQAGISPPVVAINSLSGNCKLPDVAELKEVLNMQYLVRCIEWMYFNSQENHYEEDLLEMQNSLYPARRRRFPECLSRGIPEANNATVDSFQNEFYRAMYRLLLAGAVLAKPYMAPLFQARQEKNWGFCDRCGHEDFGNRYYELWEPSWVGPTKRQEDAAYLRQFPVYNYNETDWSDTGVWRNREYETCFGPFASWIIEDGRKRQRSEPPDPSYTEPEWAENSDDVGAVRELMLLLVAYNHFRVQFYPSSRRNEYEPAYKKKARKQECLNCTIWHLPL